MNSIDKIDELFKQLSENSDKLSVILPQLYPIALEQKDFVGFCLLYLWGTPLGTCNEANQLYFQNATNMMRLAGISEEDASKIEATAAEQYLSMRDINKDNVPKDKIKIWSARELEDFLQRCDMIISGLKVPDGLDPIDSYVREQNIAKQKLSILSDKTKAENQYAILQNLISSKLAEYKTTLSQIQATLQADIFDSEIESAKHLLKRGFLRAAGAVCGVLIEKHLACVCKNRSIVIKKKNPTIVDYNDALKDIAYETIEWRKIQVLGDIRNLCDHSKDKEPTKDEVEELIAGTERIIKTVF